MNRDSGAFRPDRRRFLEVAGTAAIGLAASGGNLAGAGQRAPRARMGVDAFSLGPQNWTPLQVLDWASKLGVDMVHFSEVRFLGSPKWQEALAPGFGLTELASLLANHTDAQGVMLFGHEPDFSAVIGQLIATPDAAQVEMKKGACCALDLPDPAAAQLAGSATLLWLMTPRQLALLGE